MSTAERLMSDDENGRVWTVTTSIHCTASRHDTIAAYKNHGCRCPTASRRTVDYERRRGSGKIRPSEPAELTMRRLQALAVMGWAAQTLAPLVGRDPVSLSETRRGRHSLVTGRTAAAVHQVYRNLHDQQGPSARARAHAARRGWRGPSILLLYGAADEVKVARAIHGERCDLTRSERLTAVHTLRTAGLSYPEIARRLHTAQRQIHRDLVDLDMVTHRRSLKETG